VSPQRDSLNAELLGSNAKPAGARKGGRRARRLRHPLAFRALRERKLWRPRHASSGLLAAPGRADLGRSPSLCRTQTSFPSGLGLEEKRGDLASVPWSHNQTVYGAGGVLSTRRGPGMAAFQGRFAPSLGRVGGERSLEKLPTLAPTLGGSVLGSRGKVRTGATHHLERSRPFGGARPEGKGSASDPGR
jgi:hypothetical protein